MLAMPIKSISLRKTGRVVGADKWWFYLPGLTKKVFRIVTVQNDLGVLRLYLHLDKRNLHFLFHENLVNVDVFAVQWN